MTAVEPERPSPGAAAPEMIEALRGVEKALAQCGLEPELLELVKIRASQINGCAFCIQMHAAAARRLGTTEERLDLVAAWREAACYSPRERAALAWAEAITRIAETRAPDADFAALAAQFDPAEQVRLTTAIATINAWNRLMVGFRVPPARIKPRAAAG